VPLIIVAAVAIPLIGVGNSINSAVKDISRGTSSSGGASPQPAPTPATDFIVLSSPPGVAIQWVLFAKGPTHPGFTALLNGSGLGRIPS
jgi:hypothetical protein